MGNYFQKDIECADREVIRDIQSRRLVEQVKHVWDNVAPYRKKMEEAGLTPDDIKSVDYISFRLQKRASSEITILTAF